jgi:hypothetical protein
MTSIRDVSDGACNASRHGARAMLARAARLGPLLGLAWALAGCGTPAVPALSGTAASTATGAMQIGRAHV